MHILPAAAFAVAASLCACSDKEQETIKLASDPETFPTLKTVNVDSYVSDSSYTRYRIQAPLWLMFEEAKEPHWSFPKGLYAVRFDNNMNENGSFTADTATYFSQKRLWRFDSNVRMINNMGDKFLTEQLFWDQQESKLYSDSFIHIERTDRVLEGYGFESNQDMTEYIVRKPTGIFPTSTFMNRESRVADPQPLLDSDEDGDSASAQSAAPAPTPAAKTVTDSAGSAASAPGRKTLPGKLRPARSRQQ